MLLSRPTPLLANGAGATWTGSIVTSTAGLFDGRPGPLTRLAWPQDGGTATLQVSFPIGRSVTPRIVALVNVEGWPDGDAGNIDYALKLVGGAYDYQPGSATLVRSPTGQRNLFVVLPDGLDPVEGCEFSFDGAALSLDDEFSIGEVVVAGAFEFPIDPSWSVRDVDVAADNLSKSGALYLQPVPVSREYRVTLAPIRPFEVIPSDLSHDLEDARGIVANDPRGIIVLDPRPDYAGESWAYGRAKFESVNLDGPSRKALATLTFVEMVGLSVTPSLIGPRGRPIDV